MVLIGPALFLAALAAGGADPTPPFARYPAAAARTAHAAPVRLATPLDRQFRSALREAAAGRPDFAGHYVLAQIGCGAGCIRPAAIDRVTGRITWFPATVSGWPLEVTEPLAYRRDSRLLVVQGMLDEREPSTTRRYVLDGAGFRLLP